MSELIYQLEKFGDVIDEALPLVIKHYNEIAHYKDIPLDPDTDMYVKMEKLGILKVFTARKSGELVGYAVFIVKPNPHYKTSVQAIQDVIYIDPACRGFGHKFIIWIDLQLKDMGVKVAYQHVKVAYNFGPMLERIGYKLIDYVYGKRLG
jgi:hypothetical protein